MQDSGLFNELMQFTRWCETSEVNSIHKTMIFGQEEGMTPKPHCSPIAFTNHILKLHGETRNINLTSVNLKHLANPVSPVSKTCPNIPVITNYPTPPHPIPCKRVCANKVGRAVKK